MRVKNELKMLLFTACLGAVASAIVWIFLKAVSVCTTFIWGSLSERLSVPYFPIIVCAIGGVLIGIAHKFFGDYPEDLAVVMGKVKTEHHYDYRAMLPMLLAAFLPLIFAGSVGPEAGLTGVIVGLCYWVGDNLKYAKANKDEYTKIGEAVTLGVIFHAPLFGIFAVEEDDEPADGIALPKLSKLVLYGLSLAAALLVFSLLNHLFGKAMEGLPSFADVSATWADYLLLLIYIPVGGLLYLLFLFCEKRLGAVAKKIPVILREVIGGVCIGAVGMFVPMVLFSGEEEMGKLAETFGSYAPLFLIGVGLLKIILTTFSIQFGFKGGHFFPLIFACVCVGFGLSMLIFQGNPDSHVVFAAGIVTAATLGAQMKKPLAVSMLCLLCFPAKMLLFTFLSAAIAGKIFGREEEL